MNRAFLVAVLCAVVVLGGCYNEIVPRHPSERDGLLPIAGAANVRDLGGYAGHGGRTVRYGMIIRSGEMSTLSARDQRRFAEMGIRYVVDFRSGDLVLAFPNDHYLDAVAVSERRHAPTRLWNGAVVWDTPTSATAAPDSDQNTGIFEGTIVPEHEAIIRALPNQQLGTLDGVIQYVRVRYRYLVTESSIGTTPKIQRAQYMSFFRAVLASVNAGTPILFHCSAGKDRAGVATALLFLALGIPEREIVANYMISQPFVYERFFPVVPMVGDSVAADMLAQRALARGLDAGSGDAENMLMESIRQRALQNTMQTIFSNVMLNPGVTEAFAISTAREQVDAIATALAYGNPTDDVAIQAIQDGIDFGFQMAKTEMQALVHLSDTVIETMAREGAARIAPLLSVYPQWILAALDEIRNVWGFERGPNGTNCINAGIEAFLDGVDPYLTGAQVIQRLRDFYLE